MLNGNLTSASKLCLLTIAEFADKDGRNCFPSRTLIAEKASMNEKTAGIAIAKAVEAGFIQRTHRGKHYGWRNYDYHLVIPVDADDRAIRGGKPEGNLTSGSDEGAGDMPAAATEREGITPAAQSGTCGHFVSDVRAISPEREGDTPHYLASNQLLPSKEQRTREKAGSLNGPVIPRDNLSEREIDECHRHNLAMLEGTA